MKNSARISSALIALVAGFLLTGLWMQPALAHPGGGGGGGGGHAGGSGGHAFAGHSGGYGGAHAGSGHIAAQHFSGAYGGVHASLGRGYSPAAAGGRSAVVARTAGIGVGRGVYARSGYYGRGGYGRGAIWGGGYWGGRFWPGVYYGASFAWFLPVLPLYCSTYWWNNVPYYYYNDAYYTWSPSADGYVATDPPPVATSGDAGTNAPNDAPPAVYDSSSGPSAPAPAAAAPVTYGGAGPDDHVFAYPVQGQNEQQQASDRQQCDQWASAQTQGGNTSPDFQRAVIACFTGRGYSAQ